MHAHQWTFSMAHSRQGTLRRFSCPCGAWGYQQIDQPTLRPIRAYVVDPIPALVRRWAQEADAAQYTGGLSVPLGTIHSERPSREVAPFAWYQRDDGHWVRARG